MRECCGLESEWLLGQNVAARFGCARFDNKAAETAQVHIFSVFQVVADRAHKRFHSDLNVSFFHSGLFRNLAYDVRLVMV